MDVVKKGESIFTELLPQFTDVKDKNELKKYSLFAIYMDWGKNFCQYAIKILNIKEKQQAIDRCKEKKDKIQTQADLIQSIELVYKQEGILAWISQQI